MTPKLAIKLNSYQGLKAMADTDSRRNRSCNQTEFLSGIESDNTDLMLLT